jgi:CheY-like chemotaxis protein
MDQLMEPAVSKKARLRIELEDGLPQIKADPAQLRQVVMNLILNASDALEGEAGSVDVRVRKITAGRELLRRAFVGRDLPAGEYVALEVSDTGCGMDSETLARVFDPFFTTKFTGRGLGLASSLGIVRGHHGAILVESKRQGGTTFQVLFPAQAGIVPLVPDASEPEAPAEGPRASGEWGRVLVVDDEPSVRKLAMNALERRGFKTILAEDGGEGVRLFQERKAEIDAVLLDLTMPGMDGREALEEIRAVDQKVPVILSSGYGEDVALQGLDESATLRFLRKPYSPEALCEMLTAVTGKGLRGKPTLVEDQKKSSA